MKRVRLDDELISQGICDNRADALRTLIPVGYLASMLVARRVDLQIAFSSAALLM